MAKSPLRSFIGSVQKIGSFGAGPISTPAQRRIRPMKEAGTSGTPIFGGYVTQKERRRELIGSERYVTYSDIMANVSIVAAGLRFFLNLVARPAWKVEPAKDLPDGSSSDAAKAAAEFMDSVLNGTDTNLTRIVRRMGMYRFYGYGIHEWNAKRRPDGLIGLESIEVRPCHTIDKWDVDERGSVLGVFQTSPQNGAELYIPRGKVVYLLDDTLTDSPEGLGIFRQLVEPAERLSRYLKLEGQGYERDLRGIPVGRIPYGEIQEAVRNGVFTEAEGKKLTQGLEDFVKLQVKDESTGLVLDSTPYVATTDNGETISPAMKWGIELLTADSAGFADIAKAIERLRYDMAAIIGVEQLLIGSSSSGGSRALSEDKSRNLYLQANSCLQDITEAAERDLIAPVWQLNGLPDELKPSLTAEDVAFVDAEEVARTLRDMASAGAVLAPDDPVIDDVRDILGVSRQPEMSPEELALMRDARLQGLQGNPPGSQGGQQGEEPSIPDEERNDG